MKFCCIIPSRCSCPSAVCLTFKHNPQCVSATVFQCTDTGCKTITCRTSNDQCLLCSLYLSLLTGILCLISYTLRTSLWVCGGADIFSYFWFNDHIFSLLNFTNQLLSFHQINLSDWLYFVKYFDSQNIIAKKKQNVKQKYFFLAYVLLFNIQISLFYYFAVVLPKPPLRISVASSSTVIPYSTKMPCINPVSVGIIRVLFSLESFVSFAKM